jgi:hypothetical protein
MQGSHISNDRREGGVGGGGRRRIVAMMVTQLHNSLILVLMPFYCTLSCIYDELSV